MSERRNTNERYKHFTQELFTAGDYEQFVTFLRAHRQSMNSEEDRRASEETECDYRQALFQHERWGWSKYTCGTDLLGTFEYMFHKFKKGIYVQIANNQLKVFLPFSNVDYRNEVPESLTFDKSKYPSFEDIYKQICHFEKREYFPNRVCRYPSQWYCNNGLVRYEFPLKENDSGINMIHDMFLTLCRERTIPDCEFFINKRDFPILTLNGTEPYDALVPPGTPLLSYNNPNYLPILGMTTGHDFADIPIPTWEDWSRCAYQKDERVFGKHFKTFSDTFDLDFMSKRPTLVFRGASTGLGTTLEDNPRLFFSKLSQQGRIKEYDENRPFLDVGITKWNIRPRKRQHCDFLDIPNPDHLQLPLVEPLTPLEQSAYKYILHLPGHSFAYRLSVELSMGSVVFLYPSEYSIWYLPLLKPYEHYIPLERGMDSEEVFEKIRWCDAHPDECVNIAQKAREFYTQYLSYSSTLDYLQQVCTKLSSIFEFPKHSFVDMSRHFDDVRKQQILATSSAMDVPSSFVCEEDSDAKTLKETRHTKIILSKGFVFKQKDCDMTHSHFVSTVLEQQVSWLCPNFSYTTAISDDHKTLVSSASDVANFVMPLDAYLQSTKFRMHQFKLILHQVMLSLRIAQNKVCFMHYDLCPWNILLYACVSSRLEYLYYDRTTTLQGCHYLAKIIDYEYACIENNNELVHHMQPFFLSENHDMITLVYNSFHILLKHQKLAKDELQWVRTVLCSISGKDFWSVHDMKYFLSTERKFSRLVLSSEKESKMNVQGIPSTLFLRLAKFCQTSSVTTTHEPNDWMTTMMMTTRPLSIEDELLLKVEQDNASCPLDQMYAFEKMYEYYDNCFKESFNEELLTPARQEFLSTRRKAYLDIKLVYDEKEFPVLPAVVHDTTTYKHLLTEWGKVRWLAFSKVSSLRLMDGAHKNKDEDLVRIHKVLYLLKRGYVMDNAVEFRRKALHCLSQSYDNYVWKTSTRLLTKLSSST